MLTLPRSVTKTGGKLEGPEPRNEEVSRWSWPQRNFLLALKSIAQAEDDL
ncbi:MAG: hypothetical protein IIB30_01140 [Chloroflexi bacterium]|nr:hypothetical protein [Chloroflexota bacterium]